LLITTKPSAQVDGLPLEPLSAADTDRSRRRDKDRHDDQGRQKDREGQRKIRHARIPALLRIALDRCEFSPKKVQTMMGHASIKLTFDTSGHLFDAREDDDKAMKKIQAKVLG
jgi:integrase